MTRCLAKTTSALPIALLPAQGMITPSRAKLAAPPGPDGPLQVQQTCAGDPTLPDRVAVPPPAICRPGSGPRRGQRQNRIAPREMSA